jgi:peroxiredoxin
MEYDPANFVQKFVETRKLPFTVALDTQGTVAKAFGDVKLTPMAFLIDKNGNIIKRYLGLYDKSELRKSIEKALAS